jgi:Ser/Thr protein kinase RdoA (MazF antagonist)
MITNSLVVQASAEWGIDGRSAMLLAQRENTVFAVSDPRGEKYALRFHRLNFRTDDEIKSELRMMQKLSESGLKTPNPMTTSTGDVLMRLGGYQIDVLSWLEGQTLVELPKDQQLDAYHNLGKAATHMHVIFDEWKDQSLLNRPSWDQSGLLGENPVWGPFWTHPDLSQSDRDVLGKAKNSVAYELSKMAEQLDYGLIHADLVRENVMIMDGDIAFLDFDDSGYGFRAFEIATILQIHLEEDNYPEIRDAVLGGFGAIDARTLDMFLLLRTWTYLGWIIPRMSEDMGSDRSAKFIRRSVRRAHQWLEGQEIR